MRAFTAIDGIKLLLVICMFMVSGCAQTSYSVKEDTPVSSETATLLDITVSGDENNARVEITADKPLTYTHYQLKDPFRTVIDLSQTDPGQVPEPKAPESSPVKKVTAAKSDLSSGSLTRVTIETSDERVFSISSDPKDPRKLLIVSEQKQSVASEQGADSVAVTASQDISSSAKDTSISAAPVAQPSESAASLGKDVTPSKAETLNSVVNLTGIVAGDSGIEIKADGPLERFKYFTMTRPQRLVVDIYDAKSAVAKSSIHVKRFGVETARIGLHPDKVRIVFDSRKAVFPGFSVEKSAHGLYVAMGSKSRKFSEPVADGSKSAPSSPVSSRLSKVPARIEAIDFKMVDGFSRITITRSGECAFNQPRRTTYGMTMSMPGCVIPKRLQRPFETAAFNSNVIRMLPSQAKIKGYPEARFNIYLRKDASFTAREDGAAVVLDIKNPEQSAHAMNSKQVMPDLADSSKGMSDTAETRTVFSGKTESRWRAPEHGAVEKRSDKKIYTGRKVTLEFADADIRKIFQLIAEVSNKNILVGDDVSGTISIKLVNVPWDQALDVILQTKGLDKKEEGNIMIIRPAGKMATIADEQLAARKAYERTLDLRTKVFDVNYASVTDMAGQFNSYKSERGTISVDPRTNRIIVNDVSPSIDKMVALLKELDIPEKQVLIEARIVEATASFTQDLGIQWGIHHRDGNADFLGINSLDTGFGGIITNIPPTSGFQSATSAGGAMGLSFGKLTNNIQIDLRLSAAAENGMVKIISTPKVVTLNNKAAKISQGQMIPYSTVSAEGTKTEFIEAALTLEVTPHITSSGAVSMKIKATNNSAGSATTGTAPPINKKEATTELLVQNGETTVIGGIYVDNDSFTDSGVPFLMDIPILGWLFKSNNQKKTKSELLIFITPKIVT
jgi:type IV pilus assembly protein PilQ